MFCIAPPDYGDVSYNQVSYASSYDEVFHDDFTFSHDGAAHDALFHDEASHGALSHDGAYDNALYGAFFHASAASFPYDPDSRQGSAMQLTGVPDGPRVGLLLVRGDKKEV
jgi:hypothetical protein